MIKQPMRDSIYLVNLKNDVLVANICLKNGVLQKRLCMNGGMFSR